jgi:hypothetical protein
MRTHLLWPWLTTLATAGCADPVLIGSNVVQAAVEGIAAPDADGASPATTVDGPSPATAVEADAFVAFTFAETDAICQGPAPCNWSWSVDATGAMRCPDGATVLLPKSDLDAFLAVALRPDVLAALSDKGPCVDVRENLTNTATLEIGNNRPLVKDIAGCQYEPYDSLAAAVSALREAHCAATQ